MALRADEYRESLLLRSKNWKAKVPSDHQGHRELPTTMAGFGVPGRRPLGLVFWLEPHSQSIEGLGLRYFHLTCGWTSVEFSLHVNEKWTFCSLIKNNWNKPWLLLVLSLISLVWRDYQEFWGAVHSFWVYCVCKISKPLRSLFSLRSYCDSWSCNTTNWEAT